MKDFIKNISFKLGEFFGTSKRVATPTILQMEAAECGSTALNIVLSYFKRFVPAADLRYQCGVSRDGVNAYNIAEAAKYYGLDGVGYKASVEELTTQINVPAILWWKDNHFVVLEGFVENLVYINDPATGPRRIAFDDFKRDYSGVVITCNPTADFEKGGQKPELFRPLVKRLKSMKSVVISFISLQLFLVLTGVVLAIFSQIFIDHFFYAHIPPWASTFFWGFAFLFIVNLVALWLKGHLLNRAGRKIVISLSTRFLWHVLRLPIRFFQERYGGEIIRRMQINNRVSSIVAGEAGSLIVNTLVVVLYAIVIYQYDPLMAFVAAAIVSVQLSLIVLFNRLRLNAYARSQQDTANLTGVAIDAIMNNESFTLAGSGHFGFQRIMNSFVKIMNRFQDIGKMDVILGASTNFLTQLSSIAVLMIGGWRVMFGALTVGMLVTLQILMRRMVSPLQRLASLALLIPTLKVDLARLEDVLENPIDPLIERSESAKAEGRTTSLPPFKDEISLENITFGYSPNDEPLFKNYNLRLKAGAITGITGPNGSGKTTLAKLICSQYFPWSGRVLFDGIDAFRDSPDWIHKNVISVESENLFLQGTLKENLTLWDPTINEKQMAEACTLASINKEIENRYGQYLCMINERASNFSEGQKQRLAIARALLYQPKVLILDEALSNLDRGLQHTIMSNLSRLNMTIVVVSHRIHTLMHCERVVVLDSGKTVQDGTLDELLGQEGYFKSQFAEEFRMLKKEVL